MTGIVLLPNALLSTERATYNATTESTSAPSAYLTGVLAHIEPMRASAYTLLPDSALTAEYVATVASGTDVAPGDVIATITLLDGVTPWPGDRVANDPNTAWEVAYIRETAPLFLPQRMVYLKRVTGGGIAHP